jgi:hypothetical protein
MNLTVSWLVHKNCVVNTTVKHGKGSFKQFIREFNKYNWKYDGKEDALFDNDNKCIVFKDVLLFNDTGMIMVNPLEFWKVKRYVKKYKYKEGFKEKINWDSVEEKKESKGKVYEFKK